MKVYDFGNSKASIVLIQPVGDHDLPDMEMEINEIRKLTKIDFYMRAIKVDDWNQELTPWTASAVFGNENFGDGAEKTLNEILKLCEDKNKTYYIGGYSLAGLFSLWATYQTDRFAGVAAASPSVWYPGFVDYVKEHKCNSRRIYLSLGEKEEKTRNAVMAKVGDCILETYDWLKKEKVKCTLEWNTGGHFTDPAFRTAKAFAWVMKDKKEGKMKC